MATNITTEISAKRCGEAIARLRTIRGWSRTQLVIRLYGELEHDDPLIDTISEAWLKRLENGQMVKISRRMVEALCRALGCTAQERVHVLLLADRNTLDDPGTGPTVAAELLSYTMYLLYVDAYEVLNDLIDKRLATDLNEQEMLEIVQKVLELVIKHRLRLQAS